MPTYEYQCGKCAHRFELFQQITEKPAAQCPKCKSQAKRLISAGVGFIFKGPGFYATDHRSRDYKGKADKDSAPSPCKSCPANKNKQ